MPADRLLDLYRILNVWTGILPLGALGALENAPQGLYFRYALPLIGQILCRNRESAYRYLPESVLKFPDYEELAAKLRAHGLTDVTFRPLTFGVATLYVGSKPLRGPTV